MFRLKIIFAGCAMLAFLSACSEGDTTQKTELREIAYTQQRDNYKVYLEENGNYTPYLVLENDYQGNVLLLREELLDTVRQYDAEGSYYENSLIDQYLSGDYQEMLSVKDIICNTSIEITDETMENTSFIDRNIFLLSATEVGAKTDYLFLPEGSILSYFQDDKNLNISAQRGSMTYWTRTRYVIYDMTAVCFSATGTLMGEDVKWEYGVRPAFCLPGDTRVEWKNNAGISGYFIAK